MSPHHYNPLCAGEGQYWGCQGCLVSPGRWTALIPGAPVTSLSLSRSSECPHTPHSWSPLQHSVISQLKVRSGQSQAVHPNHRSQHCCASLLELLNLWAVSQSWRRAPWPSHSPWLSRPSMRSLHLVPLGPGDPMLSCCRKKFRGSGNSSWYRSENFYPR